MSHDLYSASINSIYIYIYMHVFTVICPYKKINKNQNDMVKILCPLNSLELSSNADVFTIL